MSQASQHMTITSANSTCTLVVPSLYTTPVTLEGYATDVSVNLADYNPITTEMGIDGHLSGGWVPQPKVVTISFAADSPSRSIMEDWDQYMETLREVLPCGLIFSLPSIHRTYTGTKGFLTQSRTMPNANQTLQAGQWQITFEKFIGAAMPAAGGLFS